MGIKNAPLDLAKELGIDSPLALNLVAGLLLVGTICAAIFAIFRVCSSLLKWLAKHRRSDEEKRRVARRRLFALHVSESIRAIDIKEDWADHRFAELEAEVEASEDSPREKFGIRLGAPRTLVRREKSLSKALRRTDERIVLLQGDPGSGKSVALRFLTRKLAKEASESDRLDSVVPLYVNLKSLSTPENAVNAQAISDFVIDTLGGGADRDVHAFLDEEFANGKQAGTWLFLFDSFDEIPAILSSTDTDHTIETYSDAIYAFMASINDCSAVIASREFRSPARRGLPKFRIVPLSERRKRELVEKSELTGADALLAIELASASPEVVALTSNPLFLSLLCDYLSEKHRLPNGWHDVFETYVNTRIDQDEVKLQSIFALDADSLRELTERVAFTMTATRGLGLNPTRDLLTAAMSAAGYEVGDVETTLDALEFIKIGKSEAAVGPNKTFTFAHRRFQEYFATNVVIREPDRVTASDLVTDFSWRETAVTLIQSQPESRALVLDAAEAVLRGASTNDPERASSSWGPGQIHVLDLLQSGFASSDATPNESLGEIVDQRLREAELAGDLLDRKWVLEVAGAASSATFTRILESATESRSEWLREVAFRQLGRLPEIPDELSRGVHWMIYEQSLKLRSKNDWYRLKAQVLRLRPQASYLASAKLLRASTFVDTVLLAAVAAITISMISPSTIDFVFGVGLFTIAVLATSAVIRPMSVRQRNATLARPSRADSVESHGLEELIQFFRSLTRTLRHRGGAGSGSTGQSTLLALTACVAFYARLVLALWLLDDQGVSATSVAITVVFVMMVSWRFAAIGASLVSPIRWPVFWPFAHFALISLAVKSAFANGLKALAKDAIEPFLILVATTSLLILVTTVEWISYLLLPFAVVGLIIMARTVLPRMFNSIYHDISDQLRLRRWTRELSEKLSATELMSRIRQMQSAPVAAQFVQHVRINQFLPYDSDSFDQIRAFLSQIEAETEDAEALELHNSAHPLENHPIDPDSLARFRNHVPDELAKLLQEIAPLAAVRGE